MDLFQQLTLSSEFIENASHKIKILYYKEGSLDINRMKPRVDNEHPDRLSLHAKVGIEAAKAMQQANISADMIDAIIVGTSHAPRNYPAVAIEIQNEMSINGYALICLLAVHQQHLLLIMPIATLHPA